ncbi:MAG TPA: hypothetical protein VGT44_09320 [Ktedonobacteraceae bacterium]|nr:hypothetical protein [Ktedonobacteraceae bacterium]
MTTRSDLLPLSCEVPDAAAAAQLSTYWMPLDEPRHTWASFGDEATLNQSLIATGHAFFALAQETKALRHFTFATEQQQHPRFAKDADWWYTQAERALYEATHHWSRAACALDTLRPTDLTPDALLEVRALSRQVRQQQERLWSLTDEVRAAIAAWRRQQQQQTTHPQEVV